MNHRALHVVALIALVVGVVWLTTIVHRQDILISEMRITINTQNRLIDMQNSRLNWWQEQTYRR
jgi:hypothetical protein